MDSDRTPSAVAEAIRAACADFNPSDALRAAVLAGLPARTPAPSPSRRWRLAVASAGLAAAAGVAIAFWPRGRETGVERPPVIRSTTERFAGPSADAVAIAKERAANRALYDAERERLHREATGKWVLIADRDPATVVGSYKPVVIGETLEELASFAPEAKHRFLFRVGDEGDIATFASSWYAPRFAGSGLARALGVDSVQGGDEIVLSRGGSKVRFAGPTPFPRVSLSIGTPDGKPAPLAGPKSPEAWLGSVGPTLMLTPEDDAYLSLARWEVPGSETVMDIPCRRVLATVAVPGLDVSATVVAAVPDVPYGRLVALSRARHQFWSWADSLQTSLDLPREGDSRGQWIVFGNDRVLGRGPTPETTLTDADARMKDVVYQRYVLRWPETLATPVARDSFEEPCALSIGGSSWRDSVVLAARRCATPEAYAIAPLDDATWVALGFHRAEGVGALILDREERLDGKPAAPFVPLGREAYVRARVGSTLTGKVEEIVASRLVLVVEDPLMAKGVPRR